MKPNTQKNQKNPPPPSKMAAVKKVTLVVLIVGAGIAIARTPVILVTDVKSGSFVLANYELLEDPFTHPRLRLLRSRERLEKVTEKGQTQFEKILLLRQWTYQQWKSHGSFYYPPWDAVEILDLSRAYNNRGFCAQYAMVFLQACQSLGIHARYVELPGHFITGVWSDDYNRWIVMDPSSDWHYERDGIPMTGRQVCAAYWKKNTKGIFQVRSDGTKKQATLDDLSQFRKYSIVKNANQLSQPAMVSVNSGPLRPLVHESDFRRYPLVGRDRVAIESLYLAWKRDGSMETFDDKPHSDDADDFRYPMNQTLIFAARRNPKIGLLKAQLLSENSPTFAAFVLRVDDQPWQETPFNEVFWQLKPGFSRMKARIKTKGGWLCPVSEMTVFYKPAYLTFTSKTSQQT